MNTQVEVNNKLIKFTYEDYLHFPEGKRYEIIEGEGGISTSYEFIKV